MGILKFLGAGAAGGKFLSGDAPSGGPLIVQTPTAFAVPGVWIPVLPAGMTRWI